MDIGEWQEGGEAVQHWWEGFWLDRRSCRLETGAERQAERLMALNAVELDIMLTTMGETEQKKRRTRPKSFGISRSRRRSERSDSA